LTWFLLEADITARETPEETRLAFFTVLIVRELARMPDADEARQLVDAYLREVHAPFDWDVEVIAVEELAT
jgi:hypothetical protein